MCFASCNACCSLLLLILSRSLEPAMQVFKVGNTCGPTSTAPAVALRDAKPAITGCTSREVGNCCCHSGPVFAQCFLLGSGKHTQLSVLRAEVLVGGPGLGELELGLPWPAGPVELMGMGTVCLALQVLSVFQQQHTIVVSACTASCAFNNFNSEKARQCLQCQRQQPSNWRRAAVGLHGENRSPKLMSAYCCLSSLSTREGSNQ